MAAHFVEYMREGDLCEDAGYTCPYPRLQELVDEKHSSLTALLHRWRDGR